MIRSGSAAIQLLLATVLLSACTSTELPYTTREREAYTSLESANHATTRLDYDGALSYFERACAQFAAIDATNGLLLCQTNMAALHIKLGRLSQAEDILQHVIRVSERSGAKHLAGTARLYLAFIRLTNREYDSVLRIVDQAIGEVDDKDEKRRGTQYRAEALLETGRPEECIQAAADSLGSRVPGRDSYARTLIARAHIKSARWNEAIRSMELAARLDREQGLSDLLAYDYELLSSVHEKASNIPAAIDLADRALNINLAINRYEPSRRLLRRLIQLHQSGSGNALEIERLQRTMKRIERLR